MKQSRHQNYQAILFFFIIKILLKKNGKLFLSSKRKDAILEAENENFEIDEEENTLSILNRYIDESEFEYDKNIIKGIFQDLYRQACEVD